MTLFKGLIFTAIFTSILTGCGQGAVPAEANPSSATAQPAAIIEGIVNAPHIEPPFVRSGGRIVPKDVPGSTNSFPVPEQVEYSGTSN